MAQHVILSGATGFLGGHLCSALVHEGHEVSALVRGRSKLDRLKGLPVALVRADRPEEMRAFDWSSCDVLIHTATNYGRTGESPADLVRDNVLFPLQVIGHMPARSAIINTDTFFAKPGVGGLELPAYTLCKQQLLAWLRADGERRVVNMRLEHVFGPHDSDRKFVPSILNKLLSGQPTISLSEGSQERDFIFVADVVDAFLTVLRHLEALAPGVREIELGLGRPMTVRAFVELMKRVSGADSHLDFGSVPSRPGGIQTSKADLRAMAAWGWSPSWTLEAGLEACVATLRVEAA